MDCREARLDTGKLARIEFELVAIRADLARGLAQLDARGLEQGNDLRECRIVNGVRVELRDQCREPADEGGVGFRQLVLRRGCRFEQRGGVRKPRLRLRQRRPLVDGRAERRELPPARFEKIAFRRRFARRGAGCVALFRRRAPLAPCIGGLAREHGETAERVEQRALEVGGKQRLVGVLAVQVDQHFAHPFELREGGRMPVDPGTTSSLRVLCPAQEQRCAVGSCVVRQSLFREPGDDTGMRPHVEGRGELGAFGAGLQLAELEAVAQEQRERVEQYRLAGAGLAGEHRKAAGKLEVERLDDDEIADGKEPQHARSATAAARSGVSLQCSFSRSIAKWS